MSFLGTDGNKKMKKKKKKVKVSDWKVWKKRCNQKKDTNLKVRIKNNYYEKLSELPLDKISNTYSKIVPGYFLKLCSEYSEKASKHSVKVLKYIHHCLLLWLDILDAIGWMKMLLPGFRYFSASKCLSVAQDWVMGIISDQLIIWWWWILKQIKMILMTFIFDSKRIKLFQPASLY